MNPPQISYVIPTYNEHGNISRLIQALNRISKENNLTYEIIVVDDNSTDGTIEDVQNLQKNQDNLILIVRERLMGIGTAHIEGYNKAIGEIIISMDADLSHPPEKVPEFLQMIKKGYDMVMSSRYVPGGATDKNLNNYLISKLGGYFLSVTLRINITDFSTGYRAIRSSVWQKIKDYTYSSKNTFLIESIYFAHKHNAKLGEVPIFFKEREIGVSKTPLLREAIKAIILPILIRLRWLKASKVK